MENFSALSAEELIELAYAKRDEFFALHDSDDFSDDTLDEMAELVETLEALQVEADNRVALAAKREELAARVQSVSLSQATDVVEAEDAEEFGTLPPALAAGIVKKLKAQLAKETDDAKKAEIQAKIDKFEKK